MCGTENKYASILQYTILTSTTENYTVQSNVL